MATDYTFGIEEEFFVVDARTLNSARSLPPQFLTRCRDLLGDRVSLELLQSQIETQTQPHGDAREALAELRVLRAGVAGVAEDFGTTLIAAGTHPFADWQAQRHTERARYRMVMNDLQMLGYRNLLCGLHVHVGVPDPGRRVELMTRAMPFLPLFLALSTSSPFWRGRSTGLLSYRPAAYDELPRTGLPPVFRHEADYGAFVAQLVGAGIIPDASYVWWSIRPSLAHPTLELRIADACTRPEDAVAVAMLFRALVHRLDRDPGYGVAVDAVVRAVTEENRWRVQRAGLDARIVDVQRGGAVTVRTALRRLVKELAPDARATGRASDLDGVKAILDFGTSADRQLEIFGTARDGDRTRQDALYRVASWLARETVETTAAPRAAARPELRLVAP
ncbi:carboxylate-amine ligase [Prosthecomicrobium sp. N25]|uniref:carboxylate-amine ligase n=1 Tax=Prosthecomicrobium sp. N25 TaxID=3129254 RepID=UPI0030776EB6